MYVGVARHYDILIDNNNDPVNDREPLKSYMDKWDGQKFIDDLGLDGSKNVLEIGVGSGRLAVRVAPLCKHFCGIDISPKTVDRAKHNLQNYENVLLICDDFLSFDFDSTFDVIYSSLTFMHIKDKQIALNKIATLLPINGRFVLSIDKNPQEFIDTGYSQIKIYPDNPVEMTGYIKSSGLQILQKYETEFAHIFVCETEEEK